MKSPKYSILGLIASSTLLFACSEPFSGSCVETRTCPPPQNGGAGGGAGDSGEASGGNAGDGQGGGSNAGSGGTLGELGGSAGAASGGSAGNGSNEDRLEVLVGDVPTAGINQTYFHRFAVKGRPNDTYAWRISSGALPPGTVLTKDGRVRGTPTVEGSYEFEVEATSAANASGKASASITVIRKRWVAYTLGTQLFATDVASGAFAKTNLSDDIEAGGAGLEAWWSPDGSKLAVEVRKTADVKSTELRVFDMTTSLPQQSSRVNTGEDVYSVDWSPDSARLVYYPKGNNDIKYVDVTTPAPESPQRIGVIPQHKGLTWLNSESIAFTSAEGMTYTFREASQWTSPKELKSTVFSGERPKQLNLITFEQDSALQQLWYGERLSDCGAHFALMEFDPPKSHDLRSGYVPSPGFLYFAGFDPIQKALVVANRADFLSGKQGSTLARSTGCPVLVWAAYDLQLASVDDANKVVVSNMEDSAVTTRVVPGSYPPPLKMYWSADGRALLFQGDVAPYDLYMARITAGVPEPAFLVNTALKEGGVFDKALAPDGSSVAYLAPQDTPTVSEVYVVRQPGAPRKLNTTVQGFKKAVEVRWSADSRHVFFRAFVDESGDLETNSYVIDVTNPSSRAMKITGDNFFGFQP